MCVFVRRTPLALSKWLFEAASKSHCRILSLLYGSFAKETYHFVMISLPSIHSRCHCFTLHTPIHTGHIGLIWDMTHIGHDLIGTWLIWDRLIWDMAHTGHDSHGTWLTRRHPCTFQNHGFTLIHPSLLCWHNRRCTHTNFFRESRTNGLLHMQESRTLYWYALTTCTLTSSLITYCAVSHELMYLRESRTL